MATQVDAIHTSDFLNQVIEDTGITQSDASPETEEPNDEYLVVEEEIGKENAQTIFAYKGMRQCPFCHAKFAIHLDVQKHMDLYHNEDRPHACGECGIRYHFPGELKTHIMNVHKNNRPHKCTECDKRFASKGSLARHLLIHTGERDHECNVCFRRFRMAYSLKEHMQTHTGVRPHECDFCGKTWTNRTDLRIHLLQHSGIQEHLCDICGKGFYSAKRLSRHKKTHEKAVQKAESMPMHKCPYCKLFFVHLANLNQHIKQHHITKKKEVVPVENITAYYCSHCKTHYSSIGDLTAHVRNDHGYFECMRCNKQFKDKDSVRQHVRETHANTEGVPCHVCDRDFPNDDVLAIHLAAHAQFTCSHCNSPFTSLSKLKEHLTKDHDSNAMEICNVCSQKFINKQRLQRHLLCHAHPAPLRCVYCKADFNHDKSLTNHVEQVHNIARKILSKKAEPMENFQLDYNGSTMNVVFADPNTGREDLKTMVVGEEEDIYQCKVCSTEFSDREDLDIHLNDHDSAEIVLSIISKQRQEQDALPKDIIVTRASEETSELECPICDAEFVSEAVYKAHVEKHEADDKNKDDFEEQEEVDDSDSEEGSESRPREMPYVSDQPKQDGTKFKSTRCPYCDRNLPTIEDLEVHVNLHEEDLDFKCYQCNEEFLIGEDLLKHKDVHQRRRRRNYQCAHCGVIIEDSATMKLHMATHNQGMDLLAPMSTNKNNYIDCNDKSTIAKRFKCATCSFFFDSKDQLRRHLTVHRDQKPHECTTCGRGFTKISTLKYHEKSHRLVSPYGCSICNDKFDQPHKLTAHMNMHGKGRFVCAQCDSRFHTQSDLTRHISTHKATPAFACAICDSKFLSSRALRQHSRAHEQNAKKLVDGTQAIAEPVESVAEYVTSEGEERCFWCVICSASFLKEEELTEHGRTHFKCDHCATEFQDSLEVECHMLDHHALDKNICLTCGEGFDESAHLWEHTSQLHPESSTCLCDKCHSICLTPRHRKIHIMSHPLEQESDMHCDFYCDICRLLFTTESFLNIHNERHKPCGICEEVSEDLTLHLLQNHSLPQVEKCYHCDRVLTDPDTRADHLNMHVLHPQVLERCTDCENGFGDIESLIEHMKVGHNCDAAKCIICGMLCLGTDDLNEHLRIEHMVYDVQRCFQCSSIFMNATFDDMVKHAASHEVKVELTCCTCSTKFDSELSLQQHLQTHQFLDNLYKCLECPEKFRNTKEFRNHMRQQHGVFAKIEKCRIGCGICQKILNLESIGSHVKLHLVGTKSFPCSICPLIFTSKNSLERHVLIHTDERPAICDVCGQGFRNLDRLSQHQRRHTKQYRHHCSFKGCKQKFFAKSKLRDHQAKKHGFDAPFGCVLCDAKFVFRRQLRMHMKRHTGTLQYPCQVCDSVFADENVMRRHMLNLHQQHRTRKDPYPKICESCSMPLYSYGMEVKHVCPTEHVTFAEVYDHGKGVGEISTPGETPLITGPTARDGKTIMESFEDEMETNDVALDDETGEMALVDPPNDYVYVTMETGMDNYCSICMIQFSSPEEVSSHMLLHQDNPPMGDE